MKRILLALAALAICGGLAARKAGGALAGLQLPPSMVLTEFWQTAAWYPMYYLMWALVAVPVRALALQVPFRRTNWFWPLALHSVVGVLVAAIAPVLLAMVYGATVLGFSLPSINQLTSPIWVALARYRALSDVPLYWLIVGVTAAESMYDKWQDGRRRAAELERSLAMAQVGALKMKLQPHFLFNTLNSIAVLAMEKDRDGVLTMVDRLSRLLDASVRRTDDQMVTLGEELSVLEQYLSIEEVRFKDRLRVVRQIDPAALGVRLPSLVLQPIVENSLKHGFSRRLEASCLEITARVGGDALLIEVLDDGPGLPPGWTFERGCGRGLANVRERLDAIYRGAASLSLESRRAGGTAARLSIPSRLAP